MREQMYDAAQPNTTPGHVKVSGRMCRCGGPRWTRTTYLRVRERSTLCTRHGISSDTPDRCGRNYVVTYGWSPDAG
jgi:hypothetical protein